MNTFLINRQHTEVTLEISLQEDQDGVCLTHQITGRWQGVQHICLKRAHVQAIRQSWSSILDQQKTVVLEDSLDQTNRSFEIAHITRLEEHIHLYHATTQHAEECVMQVADFEAFLRWYEESHELQETKDHA
jgi:hypothetical protein